MTMRTRMIREEIFLCEFFTTQKPYFTTSHNKMRVHNAFHFEVECKLINPNLRYDYTGHKFLVQLETSDEPN
jgi:hypothetical protein